MIDEIECTYCKSLKNTVDTRTHSLYTAPGKVVYITSCLECFDKMDKQLQDHWFEYYREICSGD